jgi:ABC-type lipoprotein release transport system permease subunit
MKEIDWRMIVYITLIPTLGITLCTIILFKILEVINKMLESRFETIIKRAPSITIVDRDVDKLESTLKEFIRQSDIIDETETDRRLVGFAKKFIEKIKEQRKIIKQLELDDQRKAMEEYFANLDNETTYNNEKTEIVDLTEIIPNDNRQNEELDEDIKKKE